MRRQARLAILAGWAVVVAAATPAWPQADESASTEVESGKDLYLRHCALCHGIDGTGNGPLAAAMQTAPSDLTRITVEHDDTFPAAKIADVIRNGGGVLGHGSTAMLAWGTYFSERRKPEVARGRIKALVGYIESIQQK